MWKAVKLSFNLNKRSLETEDERCRFVKAKYIFAFFVALSATYVAYDLADIINTYYPLSILGIQIYQSISIVLAAIGVWGQPGWDIQTSSGKSKTEILNEKISKTLSFVGFFLTLSSIHLITV